MALFSQRTVRNYDNEEIVSTVLSKQNNDLKFLFFFNRSRAVSCTWCRSHDFVSHFDWSIMLFDYPDWPDSIHNLSQHCIRAVLLRFGLGWVLWQRFSFEFRKEIGFALATLCDCGLKTRANYSSNHKYNRNSLALVFPRFASATCYYFEFWLAHCIVCGFCDWPERFLLVLVLTAYITFNFQALIWTQHMTCCSRSL